MTHPPAEETVNLLTPDQAEFLGWLCLPMNERKPQLQADWARKHGINRPGTLSEWKRNPHFKAALRAYRLELADEISAEALAGWRKLIRRGSWPAIEAALQYAGILLPDNQQPPTTTVNVLPTINPEEARRLLELAEASAAGRLVASPHPPLPSRESLGLDAGSHPSNLSILEAGVKE